MESPFAFWQALAHVHYRHSEAASEAGSASVLLQGMAQTPRPHAGATCRARWRLGLVDFTARNREAGLFRFDFGGARFRAFVRTGRLADAKPARHRGAMVNLG